MSRDDENASCASAAAPTIADETILDRFDDLDAVDRHLLARPDAAERRGMNVDGLDSHRRQHLRGLIHRIAPAAALPSAEIAGCAP